MKLLLDHGENVDEKDISSMTPLHRAVDNDYIDTVKLLLDHGANVHEETDDGVTAIHLAAMGRGSSTNLVVKLLLDNGANIEVKEEDGGTPLHRAGGDAPPDTVKLDHCEAGSWCQYS